MLTEKEKLEEELKLLEESLSLEVITKEEYDQTKQRIEVKLNTLDNDDKSEIKEPKKDKVKIKKIKEDSKEGEEKTVSGEEVSKDEEEKPQEEKIETVSKKEPKEGEEKSNLKEKQSASEEDEEDPNESEKVKSAEDIALEQVKKASEREDNEKQEAVPVTNPEQKTEDTESTFEFSRGAFKVLVYTVVILLIAFGSYFFFFTGNQGLDDISANTVVIACNSDADCKKAGLAGTCENTGTKDSKCKYIEDVQVKLTVLNNNGCFNCDTGRVLSILTGFFPNLDIENLDIESSKGIKLSEELGVDALPAYILNSSLQQTNNYHKFYNTFNKVGANFVLKNTVSNANHYLNRAEIPGKLDLIFLTSPAVGAADAEKNLEEFLTAFNNKVSFERHGETSALAKELGINTFPVFLINNKVKFSGVQAADVIKYNFCQMNNLDECDLELSKSLV
jgi:hypothetical protein